MSIDKEKVHEAVGAATGLLLGKNLTGEEYLVTLQTLVAYALAANDHKVKKIFLLNLNSDVRARRLAALKQAAQ